MICLSLWQQGGELLPNRFDDVWLDQWLVKQASKSASVELVVQVGYVTLHQP